jgi:hypothetical protein
LKFFIDKTLPVSHNPALSLKNNRQPSSASVKKYYRRPVLIAPGGWLLAARIDRRLHVVACSFVLILFSVEPLSGLDQNGDGMSDVWQKKYSVPSADADLDYSGTGLTNRQKSLLGLDPRDPNARFHLDIINDSTNNQLRLQLPTVYGKRYQIESSNDLQSWGSLNSTITGSGGVVEIA